LPVQLVLTPGQAADVSQAETLLQDADFQVVIGDKGFDSQKLVDFIEARGGIAVIPPRENRTEPRDYDREHYQDRNLVERFWNRLKQYRRVATRYEKTARNFLAFVHVASIILLLQ
jgi:transposase